MLAKTITEFFVVVVIIFSGYSLSEKPSEQRAWKAREMEASILRGNIQNESATAAATTTKAAATEW